MKVTNQVRILSICDDDGLRLSRELLLRESGFETESAASKDFLAVSYVRSFEIALICSSVHPERIASLTEMLDRYNPAIQILHLDDLRNPSASYSDLDWLLPAGPHQLLQALNAMCKQVRKGSRKSPVAHRATTLPNASLRIRFSRGLGG